MPSKDPETLNDVNCVECAPGHWFNMPTPPSNYCKKI